MADKKVNYIVTIELAGFQKLSVAEQAFQLLSESAKKQGIELDKTSKIFGDVFVKSTAKGGKSIVDFSGMLVDSEGKIQSFRTSASKVGGQLGLMSASVKDTGKTMSDFGEKSEFAKLNLVGLATRAALTIPVWFALRQALAVLGSIIPSLIKHAIDFQAQLTQIAIVGGSTRKEIDQLGRESLKLASRYGTSFKELASALEIFAQQGLNSAESLSLLGPVLRFSAVSGRKAGQVVEDLIAIQTSFNLTSKDTISILDSISNAQIKYSINTQQLTEGLRKLAPVAGALGLTLQETEGFIISVQQATRRSGTEVASGLSSIFGRLQSSETVSSLQSLAKVPLFLDEIGQATFEVTGRVRPVNEVISLLSKSFERLGESQKGTLAVLLGGRNRYSEAAATLNNYDVALKATIDSIFAFNATQTAFNKIAETTQNKLARLNAEYVELQDVTRTPINLIISAGVDQVRGLLALVKDSLNPITNKFGAQTGENFASFLGLDAEANAKKAEEERISRINSLGDAYLNLIQIQETFLSDAKSFGDLGLQKKQEETTKDIIDKLKAIPELKGLELPKFEVTDNLDAVLGKLRKFVSENKPELENQIKAIEAVKGSTETELELKNKIKDIEVEGTKNNQSKIAIAKAQLDFLNKQANLSDKDSQQLKKNLEIEIATFENKLKDLERASALNVEISKGLALGESDLQIQGRRIAYAEKIKELTGDETLLLQEKLKLNELIAEKVAQVSQDLQNSFQGSLKSLVLGETDFAGFSESLSKHIKDAFADALTKRFTEEVFQASGIGEVFGKLITGFEKKDPVLNAHEEGGNRAASALKKVFDEFILKIQGALGGGGLGGGASGGGGESSLLSGGLKAAATLAGASGGAGLLNNLKSILPSGLKSSGTGLSSSQIGLSSGSSLIDKFNFGRTTPLGADLGSKASSGGTSILSSSGIKTLGTTLGKAMGVAGGALSIFGGYQQVAQGGGFGNIAGGALSGALGGASIGMMFGGPIGAGIGALVGGGISLLGLLKKPKKTTTVQEETKTFQVASKIDVTNKELQYVNRNLVALRQDIKTYILPSSAYFSENRNTIADQFSLSASRGII
jgi:TP901 family phage tail tape measure protein